MSTWTIPDAPNNRTITFAPGPGKRLVPTPGKPGFFDVVDAVAEERTLVPLPLAKPRELAAGQVWEIEWSILGLRRYTLTVPHSASASAWCYEENGNSWIDARALLSGDLESPGRYLGTREEVAAREQAAETGKRAAEQLRHGSPPVRADLNACASAILAQLPPGTAAVEIERTDSDGVFLVSARGCSAADVKRAIVATPGLPVVLSFLAKPTPGRADHPREVKGLVYGYGPDPIGRVPLPPKAQAIIDECNSIASRMVDAWSSPSLGTPDGLRRTIARALDVSPDDVTIHESSPGVVDIEVRGMGAKRVEEAIEAMRDRLPLGSATLQAWRAPPPWTVADARREIDRVLALYRGRHTNAHRRAMMGLTERTRVASGHRTSAQVWHTSDALAFVEVLVGKGWAPARATDEALARYDEASKALPGDWHPWSCLHDFAAAITAQPKPSPTRYVASGTAWHEARSVYERERAR